MDFFGLLSLGLILLVCGALLFVGLLMTMARALLRPPRMNDGKALHILKRLGPGDLGMSFQDQSFTVQDQASHKPIKLAGWWIANPVPTTRCCILLHGYGDAKVGAIAWAPLFSRLGFNLLAIDLRAHGESEGDFTTAGFYERYDVSQVIDQLRALQPQASRELALFGISMGAAVAAGVAALRNDLAGIIMESPYADFISAAATHGQQMGMPLVRWQKQVVRLAQHQANVNFNEVAPVRLLRQIKCPVMMIHSQDDTLVHPADEAALAEAMQHRNKEYGPGVIWRVPHAGHVLGLAADPQAYQQHIARFIDALFEKSSQPPARQPIATDPHAPEAQIRSQQTALPAPPSL